MLEKEDMLKKEDFDINKYKYAENYKDNFYRFIENSKNKRGRAVKIVGIIPARLGNR